jgi:hypothetical protein
MSRNIAKGSGRLCELIDRVACACTHTHRKIYVYRGFIIIIIIMKAGVTSETSESVGGCISIFFFYFSSDARREVN